MQDINLNTTQNYTHQTLTNIDIIDIRLARLHIQTNPSSSEDDNTKTPTNYIPNKQNSKNINQSVARHAAVITNKSFRKKKYSQE